MSSSLLHRNEGAASAGAVSGPASWLVRHERALLFLIIALWSVELFLSWGRSCGFDLGAYYQMVDLLHWDRPVIGLYRCFYAYHPPLGFLLVRFVMALGIAKVQAAQVVAFSASLIALFSLRCTVSWLGLLRSGRGVAFLYLVAVFPMQRMMQSCAGLDVLIFASASIVMALSVRLLWGRPTSMQHLTLVFGLIATLVAAMMTKYSGAVVFGIPLIVALLAPASEQQRSRRDVLFIIVVAAALILPYYVLRYYLPLGTFFPSNSQWIIYGRVQSAQLWRHAHPFLYALNLFFGVPLWSDSVIPEAVRDIRLSIAWKQLWSLTLGIRWRHWNEAAFIVATLGVCVAGFARFVQGHAAKEWRRLGLLTISISALFLFAFVCYLLGARYGGWGPSKGPYIAPMIWGAGFLLTEAVYWVTERRGLVGEIAIFVLIYCLALYEVLGPMFG